jgi:hypothetical protein
MIFLLLKEKEYIATIFVHNTNEILPSVNEIFATVS